MIAGLPSRPPPQGGQLEFSFAHLLRHDQLGSLAEFVIPTLHTKAEETGVAVETLRRTLKAKKTTTTAFQPNLSRNKDLSVGLNRFRTLGTVDRRCGSVIVTSGLGRIGIREATAIWQAVWSFRSTESPSKEEGDTDQTSAKECDAARLWDYGYRIFGSFSGSE